VTGREAYRKLVWPDAPLFHQPFWLDAVAGNEWDAVIIEENNSLKAYYLFAQKKLITGRYIYMPELTQFLGPSYRLSHASQRERLQEETVLLEQLCARLPEAGEFISRWQTGYFNWLPFHWKGYQQRVRYTYQLENIKDPEGLRPHFSEKITREIRKAEKNFVVVEASGSEKLFDMIQLNFKNKNAKISVNPQLLKRVFEGCMKNECGKIWMAQDQDGKYAAAIFVAWDSTTAYYIIGAKDDSFGNSGAMSFLFRNAFQFLKDNVKRFDFEGSMIKGVENYFRSFGSTQQMFFEITSSRSILSKAKKTLREFRNS